MQAECVYVLADAFMRSLSDTSLSSKVDGKYDDWVEVLRLIYHGGKN